MKNSILHDGLRNKTFAAGFFIVASVILIALFSDIIAPYPFDSIDVANKLQAPDARHLFGTDQMGRDLFSRIVYGSRIVLRVAAIATVIEVFLGTFLGLAAGFYGGKPDKIISFATNLTWAMPPLVMALAVVTILGPGLDNVIIAISVVSWAALSRIVRAKTQGLKNYPFVEAGKAFGENNFSIMTRYIFPNIVPAIIVMATLGLPETIMSTTALGFLGLGSQPPAPDWGVILSEGLSYLGRAPWIALFPGLAIVYTVIGFNLLGEGLRDILDPRLKV